MQEGKETAWLDAQREREGADERARVVGRLAHGRSSCIDRRRRAARRPLVAPRRGCRLETVSRPSPRAPAVKTS